MNTENLDLQNTVLGLFSCLTVTPKISCRVNIAWVVLHEVNFHELLFLKAWMSVKDLQSENDHIAIPEITSLVLFYIFLKIHLEFSSGLVQHAYTNSTFHLMKA